MKYIQIPETSVIPLIKAVYNASEPKGMGHLHFRPGPLTDIEAQQLFSEQRLKIARENPNGLHNVVHMDYVLGRQCKFNVYFRKGQYYVDGDWYDHTPTQLMGILKEVGIETPSLVDM